MYILQHGLLIIGVVVLVIGYRKSNRDLLLAAALLLFLPGAIDSAYTGFLAGYSAGLSDARSR